MELYTSMYRSLLGEIMITSNEETILELLLPGQLSRISAENLISKEKEPILYAKKWLDAYFSGKHPAIDSNILSPQGTGFQKQVWQMLTHIPYGQTVTYGQIASAICQQNCIQQMSAQAVGQAVGKNPISIIIPCHRVIGSGGKLTGYAGGITLKRMLLQHEGWI